MNNLMRMTLGVLFLSALSGCATVGTSPRGLELPIEKAAIKFSADVKEGGYRVVAADELKRWLDEGRKLTILSTLSPKEDRLSGILPGALSVPMPRSEKELTPEDREHALRGAGSDKDSLVVVYGGFVACRRSHVGAKLLVEKGYKNVYRYPAGISGWIEAGYPLVK